MFRQILFLAVSLSSSLAIAQSKPVLTDQAFEEVRDISRQIMARCQPPTCLIVGLGRSPTPFTTYINQVQPGSAVDLPLSNIKNLGGSEAAFVEAMKEVDADKLYRHFDDFVGERLRNSAVKQVMVVDYTYSGRSLFNGQRMFENYLKERKLGQIGTKSLSITADPGKISARAVEQGLASSEPIALKPSGDLDGFLNFEGADQYAEWGEYDPRTSEEARKNWVNREKRERFVKEMAAKVDQFQTKCIGSYLAGMSAPAKSSGAAVVSGAALGAAAAVHSSRSCESSEVAQEPVCQLSAEVLQTKMNACQLEFAANQCEELVARAPEDAHKVRKCDAASVCQSQGLGFLLENCGGGAGDYLKDTWAQIKKIGEDAASRVDFINFCDEEPSCLREIAKGHPTLESASDENLKRIGTNRILDLVKEHADRVVREESLRRVQRERENPSLSRQTALERREKTIKAVSDVLSNLKIRYQCYSQETRVQMVCYAAASVAAPGTSAWVGLKIFNIAGKAIKAAPARFLGSHKAAAALRATELRAKYVGAFESLGPKGEEAMSKIINQLASEGYDEASILEKTSALRKSCN